MKKLAFLFVLVLGISGVSRAQYSMDFGLNLGGSTYIGEIGDPGITDGLFENPFPLYITPDQARYNVGFFYRYNFTRNIAARFEANWVRIAGADSLSDSPARLGRNLSFRTDIFEFSLMGEYAWWVKEDISRKSRIDFRADVHAGIGYALYNPMAQLDGKWYNLRPLATEGIENEYGTGTLIVPFGAGFSWTFNKKIRAGMDLTYRFTFTDYLDDVSTDYAYPEELPYVESFAFANRSDEAFERGNPDLPNRGFYNPGSIRGNPEANDGYFMVQFKVSYVLNFNNSFYKARYRSIINRRRKRTKF
jgi:hypothetical protein